MNGRGGGAGGRGGGGWRGGRGGGRGGGFGRGRGGPDMPDDVEVQYKETPLFPEYQPNPFTPLTEEEQRTVDDWKIFTESLRELPYYIDVPPPKPDIERYSDRFRKQIKNKGKSFTLVPTHLSFFPDELHGVKDLSKSKIGTKLARRDIDLKALDALAKEESGAKATNANGADDDDDPLPEEEYDEEMDEEENDYLIDHYDEDYDDLGGDASDREEF
ncbi:hypothetical protein PhCBS80983_g01226 [Powellomyces hirtus]|uniref:Uncharacterized protein n=1 Tax=Powellomyces hirtus TaxID=109895 RepID=A0A507EBX4_9FUNG|nr:hypothetical protein PhCBS80983_g01226 [Powellomyces hirtus]